MYLSAIVYVWYDISLIASFWIWRVKHSTTSKPMFRPNCANLVVMFVPAIGGQRPHPCKANSPFRLGLSRRHVEIAGLVTIAKPLRSGSKRYKRFLEEETTRLKLSTAHRSLQDRQHGLTSSKSDFLLGCMPFLRV